MNAEESDLKKKKNTIPKICYLIGAGDFAAQAYERRPPRHGDFVVAADGGYDSVSRFTGKKSKVDLLVGDFDSLTSIPTDGGIVRYPTEKDQTDMFLAMEEGLARGYRIFFIYGATGGRLDHTFGNFQLLSHLANRGGIAFLISDTENVTIIKNEDLHFTSEAKGTISVFSYGGTAKGVSLTGLRYSLDDATLESDFPLGVSNEFIGFSSEVFVKEGQLLVIWSGAVHKTVELKEIVL